jgi:hypothetical protein
MVQPWIHKAKTDSIFILAPSFIVMAIVFLFQNWLVLIEENYSFYTWLFLIVFIDVAHVYATLFKTYFVKSEFKKRKQLYISLPIICFLIGFILFLFGSQVFWSVLAYVAVFHFIRQQYGFMRLYSRNEDKTYAWIDNLIIYSATIYPMLFWFLSPKREFNWFVENEFFKYESPIFLEFVTWIYGSIMLFYIIRTTYNFLKTNRFNIPKNVIIIGTILSWYFGIVYFNNDLVFTLLNVVSHGIPYMALIYLNEIEKKNKEDLGFLSLLKHYKGVFIFVVILVVIAFSEEFLWEVLVWNEQFSIENFKLSNWKFIFIPLLTVPQFTHYLLDGFIWKSKKDKDIL